MANIGDVVHALRRGERARRAGWNGRGMEIVLISPDGEYSAGDVLPMSPNATHLHQLPLDPFVVVRTAHGTVIPWNCSQADLMANDWEILGSRVPTKQEIDACPSSEPNRDPDD